MLLVKVGDKENSSEPQKAEGVDYLVKERVLYRTFTFSLLGNDKGNQASESHITEVWNPKHFISKEDR